MLASLATLLGFLTVTAYAAPQLDVCDPNKLPAGWTAGKVTAPLVQVSQFQAKNPSIPFQCSGTVVILDGCSVSKTNLTVEGSKPFMVKDFTFGGALQTKWYAGIVTIDGSGNVVASPDAVNFAAQDVAPVAGQNSSVYSLIRDATVGYSFFSINQLRVFDLFNQQIICVAELPYQNPKATNPNSGVAVIPVTAPFNGGNLASTNTAAVSAATAPVPLPSTTGAAVGATQTPKKGGARQGARPDVFFAAVAVAGVAGVLGVLGLAL
ncbi:hypothetical protein HDU96_008399 [Phlyctochytrium bullatum]|nr:hypothetical protein HDU96_008399 [Phlyctochytrium bullatum]